jgi:exodeoxyribonuclease-5
MSILNNITSYFPGDPTYAQQEAIQQLNIYFSDKNTNKKVFLLKGYAGTGKTTMISALVQTLPKDLFDIVLLAPTGRAAKVMSNYSKIPASTIHKHIYRRTENDMGGISFQRKKNIQSKVIYIVDEASMIGNDSEYGNRGLLDDLVDYVFEKTSNFLILVGDTAQLPPVNKETSPALEASYLEVTQGLKVYEAELNVVMRQAKASGVLHNATALRNLLLKGELSFQINFQTKGFPDFYRMTSDKLEDGLRYGYDQFGADQTVILCRSNKSAVQFNRYIRQAIFFYENELEAGDLLMAVKNNYTAIPDNGSNNSFVANGDFMEIRKVLRYEEMYGYRFADIEVAFPDWNDQMTYTIKIILDTLYSTSPNLERTDYQKMLVEVEKSNESIKNKADRLDAIRKDPYLNAVQVKFAYALTCHKSQGGQWDIVFVDQGYLADEMFNLSYVRWLYTAITRAKSKVFLVNFQDRFFILE